MNLALPNCLLFDLDGTLLDSLPGIAFSVRQACESVGLRANDADLRKLLGPPIRTVLAALVATDDSVLLDQLEAAFRSSYDSVGWQLTRGFEGALDAIQAMHSEGRRLFVVTNKPRRPSLRILEREGMLPFFELIYTRNSRTPPYASKAAMIEDLLRDCEVWPSECLMFGDSMEDFHASSAMNIPMALMEHGYGEVRQTVPIAMRLHDFSGFLPYSTKGCTR